MDHAITHLVESALASPWGLLALFGVAAVDGFFPFVPSESIVVTAGVFASAGEPRLPLVIAAAAAGAFTGDHISYALGRHAGGRLTAAGRDGSRRAALQQWARGVLAAHGATVIVVGRYVPGGRTAVTLVAGAVHFPRASFSLFDGIAAASWATYASLIGYLGGAVFEDDPLAGTLLGLGLAVTVATVVALVRRWIAGRRPTTTTVLSDCPAADVTLPGPADTLRHGPGPPARRAKQPPRAPHRR